MEIKVKYICFSIFCFAYNFLTILTHLADWHIRMVISLLFLKQNLFFPPEQLHAAFKYVKLKKVLHN